MGLGCGRVGWGGGAEGLYHKCTHEIREALSYVNVLSCFSFA